MPVRSLAHYTHSLHETEENKTEENIWSSSFPPWTKQFNFYILELDAALSFSYNEKSPVRVLCGSCEKV